MIAVGITEKHGIAKEYIRNPPDSVMYSFISPAQSIYNKLFTSTAKGVLNYYDGKGVDIIEAPIFPVLTAKNWIYTPADFHTCMNFKLFGIPLPKNIRKHILNYIFTRNNFKKIIFKSEYGKKTLDSVYKNGKIPFMDKVEVIYPAVSVYGKKVDHKCTTKIVITFVGNFFPKGGAHVVDTFIMLQKIFDDIYLNLCCPDNFCTNNKLLEQQYKKKISDNLKIRFGLVDRDVLLNDIFPNTDIFVSPTYNESYGFAIQEAMACGIPVIASNYGAIPEIVENDVNGFLIDINKFSSLSKYKNYIVDDIPADLKRYIDEKLYKYLFLLITNSKLRNEMGVASLNRVRNKFSFENKNRKMKMIYENSLF